MKIDTAVLERNVMESMPVLAVPTPPPILSTGKSPEEIPPQTPVRETSLSQQPIYPMMDWHDHGYKYAQRFGFRVVPTLIEAMQERSQGKKVLTVREADIAARGMINLESQLVLAGVLDGLNYLVEGIVGLDGNAYEVRARYNRGVVFKKQYYAKAPPSQQQQALDLMKMLLHQLVEQSLPAWEEEIREGFHESLCRPEVMTQEQYDREKVRYKKLLQTSGFVESTTVEEEGVA